ncbi:MAG TPA: hypothetical protein VGM69_21725 [Chloroflexota bacterium]|jgi:hypothetical protein
MASRRAAILRGPAPAGPASQAEPPQWHDLLTRVEVLLATLREQVTEIEALAGETPRRDKGAVTRQHLLSDIDAARSAVKDARRRVASFSSPSGPVTDSATNEG